MATAGVLNGSALGRIQKERNKERYKVCEIRALPNMPRHEDAQKLLEQIAIQVKPIMIKHKWRVHLLSEFWPEEESLQGLNVKHGLHIKLRLRDNQQEFIPINNILDTMLNELCHIDRNSSDHPDFKNLIIDIKKEQDMEEPQQHQHWPLLFIMLVLCKVYDIVAKGGTPLAVIVFLGDLCIIAALEYILCGSFTSAGPMLSQLATRVATFVRDQA